VSAPPSASAGLPPALIAWVEEQVATIRKALRQTVDQARLRNRRFSARRLSRHLQRNPDYVYKMLAGYGKLKVEEVCRVLTLVTVVPHEFFFSLYPLGGDLARQLRDSQLGGAVPLPGPDQRLWIRYPQLPLLSGVAARAGEVLRAKIRQAGRTQLELSEELGYCSPHALGLALRGQTALTFGHVFQVLAALACPPDLFFAEVFGPDEGWWEAGEEWAELREVVLQRHRETLPGIEERRPLLGLHPPVKGKG